MKRQVSSIWTPDLGILGLLVAMVVVGLSSLLLSAHEPVDTAVASGMASNHAAPAPNYVTIVPGAIEVVGIREQKTAGKAMREPSARGRDAS